MQKSIVLSQIALLRSGTSDEKTKAVHAVSQQALFRDGRDMVVDEGGVELIVELLHDGTIQQKEHAAYALACCVYNGAACRIAIAGHAIEPCIALARDGSTREQKQYATFALANMAATDAATRVAIAEAGGMEFLTALAREAAERVEHTRVEKVAGTAEKATRFASPTRPPPTTLT